MFYEELDVLKKFKIFIGDNEIFNDFMVTLSDKLFLQKPNSFIESIRICARTILGAIQHKFKISFDL